MQKESTQLTKTEQAQGPLYPAFIETEKMLEHIAEVSRNIEKKVFEIFRERGFDLGDQLDDWFRAEAEMYRPTPVEIVDNGDTVTVRAEVAGFTPNEITCSLVGNTLILYGNSGTELKSEDESVFYSERKSGRFYRQLELPTEVVPDGIQTKLTDGILTIGLKKKAIDELATAAAGSVG